jgi:hypothetical protein
MATGSAIQNLGLVGMGIAIASATGDVQLRPDPRYGQGAMVSEPTLLGRLTSSLAAWRKLTGEGSGLEP